MTAEQAQSPNTLTPLQFWRNGQFVSIADVPPSTTLLQLLREHLHCKGTKEGCGQGDCGACTVVIGELDKDELNFSSVNSCIRLAHSINGKAIWTVQDLADNEGTLHPAQNAMLHAHASQCGFCTPGFVMSLFAMYQNYVAKGITITTELAKVCLSGNLCRCTGYRPILEAATQMAQFEPPCSTHLDLSNIRQALLKLKASIQANLKAQSNERPNNLRSRVQTKRTKTTQDQSSHVKSAYELPQTLEEALKLRSQYSGAQVVAGCTDAGLWITKQFKEFDHVIDLTQVNEISLFEEYPNHIAIGSAMRLTQAFDALLKDRPHLGQFFHRFAGLPIRNSATLGGNIANGSPIGDSMPLLLSLGASLVISSYKRGKIQHREIMLEDFYTGYRQNTLGADELISWIKVPKPHSNEILRAYKISKRFDDDISAVCLCINLSISNGQITFAGIGAGGVAAIPSKARQTEAFLLGKSFNKETLREAQSVLAQEFKPLSDMRASAQYRKRLLQNLLERFSIETLDLSQSSAATHTSHPVFWMDLSNDQSNIIKDILPERTPN
jgi:xanthine dehydrogenase small subunit